jgi:hypothetical protein
LSAHIRFFDKKTCSTSIIVEFLSPIAGISAKNMCCKKTDGGADTLEYDEEVVEILWVTTPDGNRPNRLRDTSTCGVATVRAPGPRASHTRSLNRRRRPLGRPNRDHGRRCAG